MRTVLRHSCCSAPVRGLSYARKFGARRWCHCIFIAFAIATVKAWMRCSKNALHIYCFINEPRRVLLRRSG
jgi:hypothetical protein